jgi:hypothetical protein
MAVFPCVVVLVPVSGRAISYALFLVNYSLIPLF